MYVHQHIHGRSQGFHETDLVSGNSDQEQLVDFRKRSQVSGREYTDVAQTPLSNLP